MRVALLNPLQVNRADFDLLTARRKGYPAYPPMGLGYLAPALRAAGHEVRYHDNYYEGLTAVIETGAADTLVFLDRWRSFLAANRDLEVVGITLMFASALANVTEYAAAARELVPGAVIVVGGAHATCAPDAVAAIPGVDYVLRAEAEATFPELLRRLAAGVPLAGLSGLVYRENQKLVRVPPASRCDHLDELASPDWDLLRMRDYHRIGRFGGAYAIPGCENQPFACVITSRGCRGHCAFCAVSDIMGGGVRTHGADRILDEIGFLHEQRGIRFFEILDDDFTADRSRALAILNGIVRRGYRITWSAKNGLIACSLDAELIAAMAASGCRYVQIGIESGNDRILRWLGKPLTVPRLLEVRALFRRHPEIYLAGYFIVGFPDETRAMMLDTYRLAQQLQLDWSAITMAQPLPGTRMFNEMVDQQLLDPDRLDAAELTFFHTTSGNRHHSAAEIHDWWHEFNLGINFLGNPNLNGGDLDRAIRDFAHVAYLVAPGRQPMALYCLGLAYAKKNEPERARAAWGEAEAILTNDPAWRKMFADRGLDVARARQALAS